MTLLLSEKQKKKRAEKFGLAQGSAQEAKKPKTEVDPEFEEAKRARAERFGTASSEIDDVRIHSLPRQLCL